mgnify:CR=1 FL=1
MVKYTTDSPVFSDEINLVERSDLVNARNHNDSLITLQQNDLALKRSLGSTDPSKGSIQTQIDNITKFKPSTTTISNNDSLITTVFGDDSKTVSEITTADNGKDTVIRKAYDAGGQLTHTYITEIDGEVITETEVDQDE